MKVIELQEFLARIEPDAEFNIEDIVRKLDIEDLKNNLEYLGCDTDEIGYNKLVQMNDQVLDKLANDDTYNQYYFEAVLEVAKENNLEVK